MTTWIDRRWAGQHGIGRYATEVCSRLTVEANDLPVTGSNLPGPGTFASVPKGLIYSPGYNAMARAERELLTVHDLIHLKTAWPGRAKYLAFYNLVARPVIRRTGAVITVSETSKREIENWIRDPKVDVINAGLGASAAFHPGVKLVVPEKPPSPDFRVFFCAQLKSHVTSHSRSEGVIPRPAQARSHETPASLPRSPLRRLRVRRRDPTGIDAS